MSGTQHQCPSVGVNWVVSFEIGKSQKVPLGNCTLGLIDSLHWFLDLGVKSSSAVRRSSEDEIPQSLTFDMQSLLQCCSPKKATWSEGRRGGNLPRSVLLSGGKLGHLAKYWEPHSTHLNVNIEQIIFYIMSRAATGKMGESAKQCERKVTKESKKAAIGSRGTEAIVTTERGWDMRGNKTDFLDISLTWMFLWFIISDPGAVIIFGFSIWSEFIDGSWFVGEDLLTPRWRMPNLSFLLLPQTLRHLLPWLINWVHNFSNLLNNRWCHVSQTLTWIFFSTEFAFCWRDKLKL